MTTISKMVGASLWAELPKTTADKLSKTASEPMFEYDNTEYSSDTFSRTNKNDKRPNLDPQEKEWVKGFIGTRREFIVEQDTEDGFEQCKITLLRTEDNRIIMSIDRYNKRQEVIYYEIDNETSKIMSKQSRTGDYLSPRRVYDKNGQVKEDNKSLENTMNKLYLGTEETDFSKEPKNGPSCIYW